MDHFLQRFETLILICWAVSTSLSLLGWSFLFLTETDKLLPKKLLIGMLLSSAAMISIIATR